MIFVKRFKALEARKWIVMIEDDVDMHYLYKRVFHNLNLEESLRLFDNAGEALDFLYEFATDTQLIFSDINMPLIDGLELKKMINEDELLSRHNIPFVFLSTSATEYDIRKSSTLGVQGFFQKGETLDDIEKTIKLVLTYWSTSILPHAIAND
jgi:CheY-like chemotaxis protein